MKTKDDELLLLGCCSLGVTLFSVMFDVNGSEVGCLHIVRVN